MSKSADDDSVAFDEKHVHDEKRAHVSKGTTAVLTLTALGIVFGDIGTSPLYALNTVLALAGGHPSAETLLGLLSLIVWAMIVTVSVKYVTFVMQADNDGEGGILALMSLLLGARKKHRPVVIACGLFGAALIYGDGAITPAISVLSAIEGLKMIEPTVAPFVLPVSVAILIGLFAVQSQGTARIGWIFGPIMTLWFAAIAGLGLWGIVQHPGVLIALNPWYGIHYLASNGLTGFAVLGGVFLAVTGAEALYADMGHIGAHPIRMAWYGLVLPALIMNYAGQTALLLSGTVHEGNVFFLLCPKALLLPMIGLSTLATIIASQAIITGAYSMTRQAIQLGWCPRLRITQTSSEGYGQIYISVVNWTLMISTVGLALGFGSSEKLAGAYGIAVSLTMFLTTCLLFVLAREVWKWKLPVAMGVCGAFLCIDIVFCTANGLKLLEGGWVPLVLAAATYTMMCTWRRGSKAMTKAMKSLTVPVEQFLEDVKHMGIPRVPGTAVFLSKTTEQTPPLVIWQVKYNKALHQHIVAVSIVITHTPWVSHDWRMSVECVAPGFWRIIGYYGFMEKPNIPVLLRTARKHGCEMDMSDVTYYVGHETILHCTDGTGLPLWQEQIFAVLQRNSAQIHEYLKLPHSHVVEIGRQIAI